MALHRAGENMSRRACSLVPRKTADKLRLILQLQNYPMNEFAITFLNTIYLGIGRFLKKVLGKKRPISINKLVAKT